MEEKQIKKFEEAINKIISKSKNTFPIRVWPDKENNRVEIYLENDVPDYLDWIKGEGADICLYRALDDNRIVGAALPMYKWDGIIINSIA